MKPTLYPVIVRCKECSDPMKLVSYRGFTYIICTRCRKAAATIPAKEMVALIQKHKYDGDRMMVWPQIL